MNNRIESQRFTESARNTAEKKTDKQKRYRQILSILYGNEMTAKEIAVIMHRKGYTPTNERNYAAPRLTELEEMGKVEAVGKKICQYTGKTVTVYKEIIK